MHDIEKNDVDIRKLFEFSSKIEMMAVNGEVLFPLWIRIPGDKGINRARVWAMRSSKEFRDNLKNEKWEDRIIYIPDVSKEDKESLVTVISGYNIRPMALEITRQVEIPYPKEPDSTDDLEAHEKWQQEVDEYPELVREQISTRIELAITKLNKQLNKLSKKELLKRYESDLIVESVENHFQDVFKNSLASLGTYEDENFKDPYFTSLEDFDSSPTLMKEQILTEMAKLELDSALLKKSQEATQ